MDGVDTSADTSASWEGGSSSEYVVAWPHGERILDVEDLLPALEGPWLDVSEVEALDERVDVSLVSASALASSTPTLDMHDSLLDALSRLQEEKARNERLQRQVDCARALADLPNTGRPAASATTIGHMWRRRVARWGVRARESQARTLLQAAARVMLARRARAVTALQRAFHAYLFGVLPCQTKTALRREVMRHRVEVARVRAEIAAKEAALDRHAEQTIARWTQTRQHLRAAEAEGQMRARAESVQRYHAILLGGSAHSIAEARSLADPDTGREVDEAAVWSGLATMAPA